MVGSMNSALCFSASRRRFFDVVMVGIAFASIPAKVFAQTSNLSSMRIATIGAGREGGALGTLFARLGHPVLFSSRHPEELKSLAATAGPTARVGTIADAVAFGEVIFLAVPYPAIEQIGRDFGPALATKLLILDVSNPIPARDGQDFVNQVASQGGPGVVTARLLKGGAIVRGFNALNFASLDKFAYHTGATRVGVPIAGDDPKAIALASRLIRETGFEPVLIGNLAKGKYLVPGTPLSGQHTPADLTQIAAELD